jgi:hypothetical protein
MHIVFPVRLDRPVYRPGAPSVPVTSIAANDDFDFVDAAGLAIQVGGHDSSSENASRGTRLTNLAGIHEGELMTT